MLSRKQIRKIKQNNKAKKAITTGALALGVGLGLTAIGSNKVDAATWTANSVESIQSTLKSEGTTPYTIKWGDTLSTITDAANKNGISTSVTRLAEINKIANVNLIYAGNKLWFNAQSGTVTAKDSNGNDRTYNLDPSKPVTDGKTGSTSNNDSSLNGSVTTPAKPSTPGNSGLNGGGSTTTPSKPGNSGSNGGTTTPSKPSKPSNPGNGNNGGGNTNTPGNGGTTTPPNNGGVVVPPPASNIYRPNATAIKADLMSLINLSANGKYWGVPTGKAPSGEDWISTEQHLSAGGNSFKNDMDVAKELYKGFLPNNLSDPSYVSAAVSNVTVTGSIDLTNHTGSVDVSDVTIKWYADPFYGLDN